MRRRYYQSFLTFLRCRPKNSNKRTAAEEQLFWPGTALLPVQKETAKGQLEWRFSYSMPLSFLVGHEFELAQDPVA